jgi:hypothetical protein
MLASSHPMARGGPTIAAAPLFPSSSFTASSAARSVARAAGAAALPVSAATSSVPLLQQMRRSFRQDVHEACALLDQGHKGAFGFLCRPLECGTGAAHTASHAEFPFLFFPSFSLLSASLPGYITARELKYVFVACMGFKPSKVSTEQSKRQNTMMTRQLMRVEQGIGRCFHCSTEKLMPAFFLLVSFAPLRIQLEIHNLLSGDPATARGILTYDQVCALLSRKQLYQPAEDVLRHLYRALDGQQRGFIVVQDLVDAVEDFARQRLTTQHTRAAHHRLFRHRLPLQSAQK